MAQPLELFGRKSLLYLGGDGAACVAHPHQILFFSGAILADQLACHPPILGQGQQPSRVDIQPTRRGQAPQLGVVKKEARIVLCPAVVGLYEGDSGGVAIFSLTAHKTHGLVKQYRHLRGLVPVGLRIHFYPVAG